MAPYVSYDQYIYLSIYLSISPYIYISIYLLTRRLNWMVLVDDGSGRNPPEQLIVLNYSRYILREINKLVIPTDSNKEVFNISPLSEYIYVYIII